MAWEYIKSSRKEHTCSNCGITIHKGDSYYRNGNKTHCDLCGKGGKKSISKKKSKSKAKTTFSAKTYKLASTICKFVAIPCIALSVIGVFGGAPGTGVFVFFSIVFTYMWKFYKKAAEDTTPAKPEATANTTKKQFDKSKVICKVLFNEYIKPERKTAWPSAQKVHGISPEQVKDLPTIKEHLPVLNQIFADAEIIVGYNIEGFDAGFLTEAGIHIPEETYYYDVMLKFAPIYGEWNDYHGDYKWQKLATCADYYGYDWGTDAAHDSLADVKATMYCFTKMI